MRAFVPSVLLCLIVSGLSWAEEEKTVNFAIPSQDLDAALKAFGTASSTQLFYSTDLVKGRNSAPLNGAFKIQEGLKTLLGPAPIIFERTGTAFTLKEKQATATDPTLPEVVVEGKKEQPRPAPVNRAEVVSEDVGYRSNAKTTVLRTPVDVMDASRNIQIVPKKLIQDLNAQGIEDALDYISNVSYLGETSGRQQSFSVRGFSQAPVLRDGMLVEQFGKISDEPYTLERIEVLKGPDSIQYGESDPGGLINLVRKKPIKDEKFVEMSVSGVTLGTVTPAVDVNGAFNDSKSVYGRLIALYEYEDSWRDFENPRHKVVFAPSLTWDISDDTSVTFMLDYTFEDSFADFGIPSFGDNIAPVEPEFVASDRDVTLEKHQLTTGYDFEHRINTEWKFQNRFRFVSSEYEYTPLFLPLGADTASGSILRFPAKQQQSADEYFFQVSALGEHDWGFVKNKLLTGVDARYSEFYSKTLFDTGSPSFLDLQNPDYSVPVPPLSADNTFNEDETYVKRISVFAQDHLYIGKHLVLSGGLRFEDLRFETDILSLDTSASRHEQDVLPQAGVTVKPISNLSIYGNYSQSFRPFFGASFGGEPNDPEQGEGYEAGVKYEFLKRRMIVSAAAFHIEKMNVATPSPDNPLVSITTGAQQSRGFEFDISGEVRKGWNLIASYGYLDTEVTKDTSNEGNRLSGVPEHQAAFWSTYEIQNGTLRGLGFGAGVNYVGSRQGNLANSTQVDSYTIGSASVFYKRDNWRINARIENITDEEYTRAVSGFSSNEPGEPINAIISFTMRF